MSVTRVTGDEGRLTPDEIRSTVFPPARFGRRGLDEEHVRAFRARVEEEIVFLLNERTSLYQHAEHLRRRVTEASGDPGYTTEAAHMQAVQILSVAQKTADRLVGEAQDYCRQLAEGAKQRRNQMLAEAQANASRMIEQADSQARAAATEAVATSPRGRHGNPEDEVAYLRTFSEVYRNHLRAYLEALLHSVDEWGRAERATFSEADGRVPQLGRPRSQ